jgi:hypothetical protein
MITYGGKTLVSINKLVKQLNELNDCEIGCEGRCLACPRDVTQDAAKTIPALIARIRELEKQT